MFYDFYNIKALPECLKVTNRLLGLSIRVFVNRHWPSLERYEIWCGRKRYYGVLTKTSNFE